MRSRWKFGIAVVVLVMAGIGWLAASWLGRSKPVPPEKIVRVERGDIARSVVAVGRIEALSKVEVKSKANGIIQSLAVDVGDKVTEGQMLAELDKENLDWNEFRATVTNLSLGLRVLLTIIGGLTLSIGAVGVMNIMLVSVAERTREIGILKALGARRHHILGQILLEGLSLTAAGGLLGFLLAALLTSLIGTLPLLGPMFEDASGRSDIHLGISFSALAIASTVLLFVGLLAGLIPALRAARLDPVAAIRSE